MITFMFKYLPFLAKAFISPTATDASKNSEPSDPLNKQASQSRKIMITGVVN